MRAIALLGLLAAGCTRQVAMGEECAETKQCGKGADCYRGICTPLCVDDNECDGELVCARHHCLEATGEPRKADGRGPIADGRLPNADSRGPSADPLPPDDVARPGLRDPPATDAPPDVAVELRAVRAELEALRHEQELLRRAVESLKPRK